MIVISCFDRTTNFVQPWARAGYLCYCVDTQHEPGVHQTGNIIKVGMDIREWLPPRGKIVFAAFFPPCTDLAVSGSRWMKGKGLSPLIESLRNFERSVKLAEWCDAPYFIENPVSVISTYWRKPDYLFDPHDYGDPYTKKTCLWTGNDFVMPIARKPVKPTEGSKMHRMGQSKNRANKRSETPKGFSEAVFRANAPYKELR